MKKILVMGRQGSGKSTFAKKLGEKLGIEVIHLDNHFHKNGWERVTKDEWRTIQAKLVSKKEWIIDGTYLSSIKPRLETADTVIFLDLPAWVSIYRAFKRYMKNKGKVRSDLKDGMHEKIDFRFIKKITTFSKRNVLAKVKEYPNVKTYILQNSKEVDKFIHNLL
jgi:adenylate kinase family enzyme